MRVLPTHDVIRKLRPVLAVLEAEMVHLVILNYIFVLNLAVLEEVAGSTIAHNVVLTCQEHDKRSRDLICDFLIELLHRPLIIQEVCHGDFCAFLVRVCHPVLKPTCKLASFHNICAEVRVESCYHLDKWHELVYLCLFFGMKA